MATKTKKAANRKASNVVVARSTLAETAQKVVQQFFLYAQPHEFLKVADEWYYPNSFFIDDKNRSHLKGVDLFSNSTYRELIESEWNLALAERYVAELRKSSWKVGRAAACRFMQTRKNEKLVRLKRTELQAILQEAEWNQIPEVPYCTQIETILSESRPKSGRSTRSGSKERSFWYTLITLVPDRMNVSELAVQSSIESDRGWMLGTYSFAEGFISGCFQFLDDSDSATPDASKPRKSGI